MIYVFSFVKFILGSTLCVFCVSPWTTQMYLWDPKNKATLHTCSSDAVWQQCDPSKTTETQVRSFSGHIHHLSGEKKKKKKKRDLSDFHHVICWDFFTQQCLGIYSQWCEREKKPTTAFRATASCWRKCLMRDGERWQVQADGGVIIKTFSWPLHTSQSQFECQGLTEYYCWA